MIKSDAGQLYLSNGGGKEINIKDLLKEKVGKVINMQGLLDLKKSETYILKIQSVFEL